MPSATTSLLRSELTAAGDGLADNEDVLRSVLAGCGDCIKILDLDGRLQFMSEGGKRVMEVDDFGPLKGCPWPDFWAGDGSTDARRAVEVAKAGGIGRFKGPANTAKGNPRHWDVQVSPIMGADGKPSHLLSISRDITEEWRAVTELKEVGRAPGSAGARTAAPHQEYAGDGRRHRQPDHAGRQRRQRPRSVCRRG